MNRSWWYRFSFMLFLFVISVMAVIPTAFNFNESSSFPVKSKINLGLDLQGGLYMVLGIDFKKVYKDEIKNYVKKIEVTLKDEGVMSSTGRVNAQDGEDPKHTIIISNPGDISKAKEVIKEFFAFPVRVRAFKASYGFG